MSNRTAFRVPITDVCGFFAVVLGLDFTYDPESDYHFGLVTVHNDFVQQVDECLHRNGFHSEWNRDERRFDVRRRAF